MTYYEQFEEIAENGNPEIIQKYINNFEAQKLRYGSLNYEDQEILTMLKNSLNWIRPFDLFEVSAKIVNY